MTTVRIERERGPFLPATVSGVGMADYALGSLESRAAARVLLSTKSECIPQNRFRVVVETIGKPITLETSSCLRYQCADIRDPGRSLVFEILSLDGNHPTQTQWEQIERWIRELPIDGRR